MMRTEYTELTSGTVDGVLRELGQYAIDRGYASEGYVEAILDREADFPTGLSVPTASFDIAIPHTDPEHVTEPAVVLGLPEEPVPFRNMDDPEQTVEAGVVMLLLAQENEGYTSFLSSLADLFQHPHFGDAVEARDHERILDLVESGCL
jgi:PTS system galactitol-specific IIA component